jgi:hypothetical protein
MAYLIRSYNGESARNVAGQVTFVRDLYSEEYIDRPADLICCRHVLEHLPDPRQLLLSLRRMLNNRSGTVVYFEVPNAESVLGGATMWDVNYPHCLYFSRPALARLFREAGFLVVRLEPCFGSPVSICGNQAGRACGTPRQGRGSDQKSCGLGLPLRPAVQSHGLVLVGFDPWRHSCQATSGAMELGS